MAAYDPDSLICRTSLLPKNENCEHLRATITKKIIETSQQLEDLHEHSIDNINYLVKVRQGRSEAVLSYNQILDHLEHKHQQDNLYKFRAIISHQGSLTKEDENYKGAFTMLW